MTSIKNELKKLVKNYRQWLSENYSVEEISKLIIDEAGYPGWPEIEDYFSELIKQNHLRTLDKKDQINLLYLIARNWDIGTMISWLSKGKQLSNLGKLNENDFIILAMTLSKLDHFDFNDAKYQFISSFKKFDHLTIEIEEILLTFYNDKNEYIKRQSLITLGKLGYSDIRDLLKHSWETIDEEYHKMACLSIIDKYLQDTELMKQYLSLTDNVEGQYLNEYVIRLRDNNKYH